MQFLMINRQEAYKLNFFFIIFLIRFISNNSKKTKKN